MQHLLWKFNLNIVFNKVFHIFIDDETEKLVVCKEGEDPNTSTYILYIYFSMLDIDNLKKHSNQLLLISL
jgi:hypothetical protein